MSEDTEYEPPHYVKRALKRLENGARLCRQVSDSLEAQEKGGGYAYFTLPDGKAFPTTSGRICIDHGLVREEGDGLFEGSSQSFRKA